jgi:predicted amidophosphoribosyltransferase
MPSPPEVESRQKRARYAALRADGMCVRCARARTGAAALCAECIAPVLERKRARYAARRADGLCGSCGSPSSETAVCPHCKWAQLVRREQREGAA